jgi:hypothetical protein
MFCLVSCSAVAQQVADPRTAGQVVQENAANSTALEADLRVPKPTSKDSYAVIYASRMLGYYRYPEYQSLKDDVCSDRITQAETPEAALFRTALDQAYPGKDWTTLRVATGDNFGPFLLARQMWDEEHALLDEKEGYSPVADDKAKTRFVWMKNYLIKKKDPDLYKNMQLGLTNPIPIDNVGCFMRLMKFDAVVPGKHDFYFGPTRLQELARYLARPIKVGDDTLKPTRMLGVNLYMQTREITSAMSQSAAAIATPQMPSLEPEPPSSKVRVTTPKIVLPWMRSVQILNMAKGSTACIVDVAVLVHALNKHEVKEIKPSDGPKICNGAAFNLDPIPTQRPNEYSGFINGDKSDKVLALDTDYAVAIVNGGLLVAWQPFIVAPPFFGYDQSKYEEAKKDPSKKLVSKLVSDDNWPWVVKKDGPKRVAIFGVVDPSLIQFVGRNNSVWLEEREVGTEVRLDDHYETDVQVSDPTEALKQAYEYCTKVKDQCDGDTRIVLLAQMPQQTAYNMLGSFRALALSGKIDLVVSEADPDRGTGNRTTARFKERDDDPEEFSDPVVVVPDPGAFADPKHLDKMHVRLQRAIVTPGDHSSVRTPRVVRNQSIRIKDDPFVPTEWFPGKLTALTNGNGAVPLIDHLRRQMWGKERAIDDTLFAHVLQDGDLPDDATWQTALRQLALKRMQRYCNSDAEMLQLRDVFFVPAFKGNLTKNGYEAVMDAIFWKGDYMQCMSVSGATITSVLQRSQDLQQKQYYGLLSDASLTLDWSLDTLGANSAQSNPSLRLVADKLLDSKKLYSIGVTDFLANGDTGYPALQGAEPPPETPWSKTRLLMLSDAITSSAAKHGHLKREEQDEKEERAEDRLDTISRVQGLPDSQQHQPDPIFSEWFKGFLNGPAVTREADFLNPKKPDRLNLSVQQRPVWSIDLYKFDFSYSMAAHSGLERAIPKYFPGVSAVDLTAADSSSVALDYLFRLQRDHGSHEIYMQNAMNYGYKKTRQASKASNLTGNCLTSFTVSEGCGDYYTRNQPADFVYNELGYAYRFHTIKNPYGWKVLLPIGVQTQLAPSISLPEGLSTPMGSAITIPSPRSVYIAGRPGFRWDYSFPKPNNWSLGQSGGGAGGSAGGGQQASSGGGKGGKGGGGSSSSQNSGQNSSGGAGGGGGGGSQTQTFDSYLELGYEFGPSLFGPKDFVFSDQTGWMTYAMNPANQSPNTPCLGQPQGGMITVPVTEVVSCFAAASASVPTKATTMNMPSFTQPIFSKIDGGRRHFQDGLYFNYHFDIPVPVPANHYTVFSNMEMVFDLRSDFFFGGKGDSPVDTHFLFDAKQALSIPIFPLFSGRVSLSPTFELIYFANKITNNLYKSYSTSISLSYTFEKRTGLNPLKVFGYPNPVPTLPTLPSR